MSTKQNKNMNQNKTKKSFKIKKTVPPSKLQLFQPRKQSKTN